jgi:riboflavin transporter FmnP
MKSRAIALIIIFVTIVISLYPTFSGLAIPSFALGRYFQFWEIPIFAALLLFGLKYAVTIAALDTVAIMILFRSGPFTNWFNIIPFMGTMLGVYVVQRIISRRESKKEMPSKRKEIICSVASGILFRYLIGFPAFYLVLKYLAQLPDSAIFAFTILNAIHDAILVAYSIPASYLIAEIIRKNLRIGIKNPIYSSNS